MKAAFQIQKDPSQPFETIPVILEIDSFSLNSRHSPVFVMSQIAIGLANTHNAKVRWSWNEGCRDSQGFPLPGDQGHYIETPTTRAEQIMTDRTSGTPRETIKT